MTEKTLHCLACGQLLNTQEVTCPHCASKQMPKRLKSKVVAGILALLLGGLGIHRFYLEQWWGIFYLLFCITGIPALIALVEAILFLAGDKQQWDEKYNQGFSSKHAGGNSTAIIAVVVVAVFFSVAFYCR